jgi:alginate biosynthesis protein Alg44
MKPIVTTQDVFKKVHLSEKKSLFRKMSDGSGQIFLKSEDDRFGQVTAVRVQNDEKLYCKLDSGAFNAKLNLEVVGNFMWEDEKYFFRTQMNFEAEQVVLRVDIDLFQLQRRKNARLDVPAAYDAVSQILSMNGDPCHFDTKLQDMSAGGCKVFFPLSAPAFKIGDKLSMNLQLGKRRAFQVTCDVRFAIKAGDGQVLGLQFLDRDHYSENRLLVLMMDLQREFYLKFGGA